MRPGAVVGSAIVAAAPLSSNAGGKLRRGTQGRAQTECRSAGQIALAAQFQAIETQAVYLEDARAAAQRDLDLMRAPFGEFTRDQDAARRAPRQNRAFIVTRAIVREAKDFFDRIAGEERNDVEMMDGDLDDRASASGP